MITATFPATSLEAGAGDRDRRTIAGVAVPWNVPGTVASGETVVFLPGSLDAARRPVALRDHDRTRPIGTVVDAVDTGDALTATVRVSAVPDGDAALTLAADGALGMFSVGAEPVDVRPDPAGVLFVHAAEWVELSLLTLGAYAAATVHTVTASTPGEPTVITATTPTEPDAPPEDPDTPEVPEEDGPVIEAAATVVPITAGRPGRPRTGVHPYADVTIRDYCNLIAASRAGDDQAAGLVLKMQRSPGARTVPLEAAIVDVTIGNVGPSYRPGYQAELIEYVSMGSPVVDVLRQGDLERGDYPNKTFNQWTATPQVALQSAEKALINSTAVTIAPVSVPVKTWATGNDVSQQLLDFGSPSFLEDYVRAAAVDYAETIDTYAVTALLAAAVPVTTLAGDSFAVVLGKLFAALNPTKVPGGGLFLAVSYDVQASLVAIPESAKPAFWDGQIGLGSYMPSANVGGLQVISDPNLPAKTFLLGLKNAATWYDLPGTPFSLRAFNPQLLGLDIAVYGYGAVGVQYPLALVKTTQP